MASIKTNKNQTPILKTNFSWLEILCLTLKDFFTLKVLKMYFVFFQVWYKILRGRGRNVLYRTCKKTKYIFGTFKVKESFWTEQQSL